MARAPPSTKMTLCKFWVSSGDCRRGTVDALAREGGVWVPSWVQGGGVTPERVRQTERLPPGAAEARAVLERWQREGFWGANGTATAQEFTTFMFGMALHVLSRLAAAPAFGKPGSSARPGVELSVTSPKVAMV